MPTEGRRFGLTVGAAFGVLGGVVWWRGHPTLAAAFGVLAAALIAGGLVVPRQMLPVRDAWMWMALRISKVTTPIVMGILYFVIITPVGLLMRATGRSPLTRHRPGDSVWVNRESSARRSDLRRQF